MGREYYDGRDHYLIYGAETSYGAGATVAATNRMGKVQGVTLNFVNNLQLGQGVGEGANATSCNYGNFGVTGSFTTHPTDFTFLQYGVGARSGSGTVDTPYLLAEYSQVGYAGSTIPTLSLELGAKGLSNHETKTVTGVTFTSWTLSGNQGGELECSVNFTGEKVTQGTTIETYTSDGLKKIAFISGSVSWNSETLSCMSFSVTCDWVSNYPLEVFNRFNKQPTKGLRRYNWSLTVPKHYDDTASTLSATELFDVFLYTATNTPATSGTPTGYDLIIQISEGAVADDRVITIGLENSFVNDWSENPTLEGGIPTITVNGFSFSGDTSGSDKVPVQWYTVT